MQAEMKFVLGSGAQSRRPSTDAVVPALPQDWRVKRPLAIVELANQEELQREVKDLKKHLQKRKKIGKQKSVPG